VERFTIAPFGVTGASIVLGDDQASDPRTTVLAPPLPAPRVEVQTVMPVRAKRAVTYARGNVVCPYTWQVTRTHTSIAAAVAFVRDHSKSIAASCVLGQFILRRTCFGVSMQSVGALRGWRCTRQVGCKTWFEYEWQGSPFE
jgi:hypothetical protein